MKIRVVMALCAGLSLAAGCGSSGGTDGGTGGGTGGGVGGGAGGGGGSNGVACCRVTSHDQLIAADGTGTPAESNLDQFSWKLLTPLSDGGFTSVAGAASKNQVLFPEQPNGKHVVWSQFQPGGIPVMWVTEANEIDVTYDIPGRASAVDAGAGTQLTVALNGIAPFDELYDSLTVFAAPNALEADLYDTTIAPPDAGDTQARLSFDWEGESANGDTAHKLLSGAAGDRLYAVQLRDGFDAGTEDITWAQSVAAGSTSAPEMVNAAETSATVALTNAPVVSTTLVYRRDLFASALQFATDAGTPGSSYFYVAPGYTNAGWFTNMPFTGFAYVPSYFPATSVTVGAAMVNPFPSNWPLVAYGYTSNQNKYVLADGGTPRVSGFVEGTALVNAGGQTVTQPLVTSPRDLRVNGLSALDVRSGVGESPTVSWTAPAQGTVTYYSVLFYELKGDPSGGTATSVARILTTDTQVVMPQGILQPGVSYAVRVSAYSAPGAGPTKPFARGFPYGRADAVSAIVIP